jgi:hypothetical protein
MSKLFIGFVPNYIARALRPTLMNFTSGLSWNTDDATLRRKFEEFGTVEEAVSKAPLPLSLLAYCLSQYRLL